MKSPWSTTGQVARRIGVTHAAVQRWCVSGKIPALRTPTGRYLVHERVLRVVVGLDPMPFPSLEDLLRESPEASA